jgi:hypothetical protein
MTTRRSMWMLRLPALLAFLALLLAPAGRAAAQAREGATMTVLLGQVAVVHPDGSAVQPAPSGMTVFPGDEIRTVGKSGALITFFQGTEIELGAETVLGVEGISKQGDRIDVSLKQVLGTAVSRVHTLADNGSSYAIDVGGAVAVVRGSELWSTTDGRFGAFLCRTGYFEIIVGGESRQCVAGSIYSFEIDPLTHTVVSIELVATGAGGDPANETVEAAQNLEEDVGGHDGVANSGAPGHHGDGHGDDGDGHEQPPAACEESLTGAAVNPQCND